MDLKKICEKIAEDWFTIAPKYRTKNYLAEHVYENVLNLIKERDDRIINTIRDQQ